MTEIGFLILLAVGSFAIILFAFLQGKEWLTALLPIFLITANVYAESFFMLFGQLASFAIPIYAATYLITDTLSEHFGKAAARRAILIGFMGQIVFLAVTLSIARLPIFPDKAEAYSAVFGVIPRLIAGSFTAYLISQLWDIQVYHLIWNKTGHGKRLLWVRNNVSTISSQLIDTAIFVTIAFWGRLDNLGSFILTTWIIKLCIATLDTPFLMFTYWIKADHRREA